MQDLSILHDVVVVWQVRATMLRLGATMLHLGLRTSSSFNSQHAATRRNRVALLLRPTMLRSVDPVAFKCCDRLAGTCKSWANNVGICCVEMLPSFGRGLRKPRRQRKQGGTSLNKRFNEQNNGCARAL